MDFERTAVTEIVRGMEQRTPLIQVVVGPRQVGKSTAAVQVIKRLGWPAHSASADSALPHPPEWIETQWQLARMEGGKRRTVLVLDEVQKVRGWSEVI